MRALMVGEFHARVIQQVAQVGLEVDVVPTLSAAFEARLDTQYAVVVVNPFTDGHGLDFISALKEDAAAHQLTVATLYGFRGGSTFLSGVRAPTLENLEALRARYAAVSFVAIGMSDTALLWVRRNERPLEPLNPRGGSFAQLVLTEARRLVATRSMRS